MNFREADHSNVSTNGENSEVSNQSSPPLPVIPPGSGGPISETTSSDVLSGRGGRINAHEGNVRFRELINEYKLAYLSKSTKKLDKAHIAAKIVEKIRNLDPPGRFLKIDTDSGLWTEIGDEKARKKAGQALREDAPDIRKNIHEERSEKKQQEQAVAMMMGMQHVGMQGYGMAPVYPHYPGSLPPPPGPGHTYPSHMISPGPGYPPVNPHVPAPHPHQMPYPNPHPHPAYFQQQGPQNPQTVYPYNNNYQGQPPVPAPIPQNYQVPQNFSVPQMNTEGNSQQQQQQPAYYHQVPAPSSSNNDAQPQTQPQVHTQMNTEGNSQQLQQQPAYYHQVPAQINGNHNPQPQTQPNVLPQMSTEGNSQQQQPTYYQQVPAQINGNHNIQPLSQPHQATPNILTQSNSTTNPSLSTTQNQNQNQNQILNQHSTNTQARETIKQSSSTTLKSSMTSNVSGITIDSDTIQILSDMKNDTPTYQEYSNKFIPASSQVNASLTTGTPASTDSNKEEKSNGGQSTFSTLKDQVKLDKDGVPVGWKHSRQYRDRDDSDEDKPSDDDDADMNSMDMSWSSRNNDLSGSKMREIEYRRQVSSSEKTLRVSNEWTSIKGLESSKNDLGNDEQDFPEDAMPPPANVSTTFHKDHASKPISNGVRGIRAEWRQQVLQMKAWQQEKSQRVAAALEAVSDTGKNSYRTENSKLSGICEENASVDELGSVDTFSLSDMMSISTGTIDRLQNGEDSFSSHSANSQNNKKINRRAMMMTMSGKNSASMLPFNINAKSTKSLISNITGDAMNDESVGNGEASWVKPYMNLTGASTNGGCDIGSWVGASSRSVLSDLSALSIDIQGDTQNSFHAKGQQQQQAFQNNEDTQHRRQRSL